MILLITHSFDKAMNHHDQSSIVNRIDDDDLSNVYHVDLEKIKRINQQSIESTNLPRGVDDRDRELELRRRRYPGLRDRLLQSNKQPLTSIVFHHQQQKKTKPNQSKSGKEYNILIV